MSTNRHSGGQQGVQQNGTQQNSAQQDNVHVEWTEPAREQIQTIANDPRFQGNAVIWHEKIVREHARNNVPQATRARIRKPVHVGGTNPAEPEHITVSYKQRNRDLGAHHVYPK